MLSQEVRIFKDSCLVYKTNCTDYKVNIRLSPSLSGKIVGKLDKDQVVYVSAISEEIDTIDSFTGPWLRVNVLDGQKKILEGWTFSRYIALGGNYRLSSFEFLSYEERRPQKANVLRLQINGGIHSRQIEVFPYKVPGKEYYTFTWNEDNSKFIYDDPAGSFIWYPKTNIIKHVTYLGQSDESAWVQFTDDLKYMIEDFGTWSGPRGLLVYDLTTDVTVFSGTYYRDINLKGYTINIVVTPNFVFGTAKFNDKEAMAEIEKFTSANPIPSTSQGLTSTPIAIYLLDFSTGKREFLSCQYIQTQ